MPQRLDSPCIFLFETIFSQTTQMRIKQMENNHVRQYESFEKEICLRSVKTKMTLMNESSINQL